MPTSPFNVTAPATWQAAYRRHGHHQQARSGLRGSAAEADLADLTRRTRQDVQHRQIITCNSASEEGAVQQCEGIERQVLVDIHMTEQVQMKLGLRVEASSVENGANAVYRFRSCC